MWTGTAGGGVGAGLKLVDWSLVGQVGKDTAGGGVGWKRVGVNLLYDRGDKVWRAGVYWAPLCTSW